MMLPRTTLPALLSLGLVLVAACDDDGTTPTSGERSQIDADEVFAEPATPRAALADTSAWFVVTRQDFRKCAAPSCGGVYVKALNRSSTRCADGTRQAECYVADFTSTDGNTYVQQYPNLKEGNGLFRGRIVNRPVGGIEAPVLEHSEVVQEAVFGEPAGVFAQFKDSGIRCFTTPCPSLIGEKINSRADAQFDELDLAYSGAAQIEIDKGTQLIADSKLLTSGYPYLYWDVSGAIGLGFAATQFYLPATPDTPNCTRNEQCGEGEFCGLAACGDIGECSIRPDFCPTVVMPVCGCDGRTYSNACFASLHGMTVASDGPCDGDK